ncbi:MAG: hypothetical protein EXR67_01230 [Dehalococcoidia bacterium]|nr:hypothetical protein [Dehalococcoidia bacterium]
MRSGNKKVCGLKRNSDSPVGASTTVTVAVARTRPPGAPGTTMSAVTVPAARSSTYQVTCPGCSVRPVAPSTMAPKANSSPGRNTAVCGRSSAYPVAPPKNASFRITTSIAEEIGVAVAPGETTCTRMAEGKLPTRAPAMNRPPCVMEPIDPSICQRSCALGTMTPSASSATRTVERKIAPGTQKELTDLLRDLQSRAVRQRGYISGEVVVDTLNPTVFMTISRWTTMAAWQQRERSADRTKIIERIDSLMQSKPVVRILSAYGARTRKCHPQPSSARLRS